MGYFLFGKITNQIKLISKNFTNFPITSIKRVIDEKINQPMIIIHDFSRYEKHFTEGDSFPLVIYHSNIPIFYNIEIKPTTKISLIRKRQIFPVNLDERDKTSINRLWGRNCIRSVVGVQKEVISDSNPLFEIVNENFVKSYNDNMYKQKYTIYYLVGNILKIETSLFNLKQVFVNCK